MLGATHGPVGPPRPPYRSDLRRPRTRARRTCTQPAPKYARGVSTRSPSGSGSAKSESVGDVSPKARVIQGSAVLAAVLALTDAACSGPGTMTSAAGPGAHRISLLSVGMFAIAAFVFLVVICFLAYGLFHRRRDADNEQPILDDGGGTRMVLLGGIAFPIVVLIVLFVITLVALEAQARDDTGSHVFTIDVIAHRWWWEFQYPNQGIDTANEVHIPTGQPVLMEVTSTDVIHSFWVPRLQRKVDA